MQLAEHRPFLKTCVQRSGRIYLRIVYLFRVNFVMLSEFFRGVVFMCRMDMQSKPQTVLTELYTDEIVYRLCMWSIQGESHRV